MPFKKNSSIKTMNSTFLKKIFKSELFLSDYRIYLEHFDELSEKENEKKIKKCINSLTDFIEKKKIEKIKSYKRLPWTSMWLSETRELAFKLLNFSDENSDIKNEFAKKS